MDYRRVYAQFVSDRRTKERELSLFERHHIQPRCVGGTDEQSNLINLSPSDHLFAHVLLARIYGGTLWWVAARMSGNPRYLGRRSRLSYQFVRERLRKEQSVRAKSLWAVPELALRMGAHKSGNQYRAGVKPNVTDGMREKLRVTMTGNRNAVGARRSPETREKLRQKALLQHARRRAGQ